MTRDQYKQMRETEVEKHKIESDQKRSDQNLSAGERAQNENVFQSMCRQQEDWARAGFWTPNEETAYRLNYEQYHDVKGSYQRSSV